MSMHIEQTPEQISDPSLECPSLEGTAGGVGAWLRRRVLATPDALAFRYLKRNGQEETLHSFRDIDAEARRLAAWLRAHGNPGDRVLLAHAPGPEFAAGFFACLYAGFIAVPAFPPRRTRHGDRVAAMVQDAGCRLALADAAGRAAMRHVQKDDERWARMRWPEAGDTGAEPLAPGDLHRPGPDDIAFLQYTSGSTGSPKGVMVSHRNLQHNMGLQIAAYGFKAGDVLVSWVPFFHDLGLIMGFLMPIAGDGSGIYFPPPDFIQSPVCWLRAISRYRATHSCGPNFAYDLCLRQVPMELRDGLDLSSWRYALNGAEPVKASTVRRFEAEFAPWGVRPGLIQPVYGLAENTMTISAGTPFEPLAEVREDAAGASGRGLVVCGRTPGQTVIIVDPVSGDLCRDGQSGEIWVQGDSVAKGYWNKPLESEETFGGRVSGMPGRFLRTGDLGFRIADRLVFSARLKDLIILRGMNHFPQDIESTAKEVSPELATGAAFSVDGPEGERLVLVQETARHPKTPLDRLAADIAQAVAQEHGVAVSELVLVQTNAVPRTSSGKVQRRACREAYLNGTLKELLRHPAPDPGIAGPSDSDRLEWIRSTALELGGREPEAGFDAPLNAWSLDSLKIVEFAARYQRRFGQDLGALDQPDRNVSELLAQSSPEDRIKVPAEPLPAQPVPATPAMPERRWRCHNALEGIWAFQQSAPHATAYHIPWTVQLEGRPDPERLETALQRLCDAQIAMRSRFEMDADAVLWQVESGVRAVLERPWQQEGGLEAATEWVGRWSMRPFDLAKAPLWRAAYLPLAGGGCLLAFVFHHTIFDQRSWEAFHESLERLVQDPDTPMEQASTPLRLEEGASEIDQSRRHWAQQLRGLADEPWLEAGFRADELPPRILKAEIPAETVSALLHLAAAVRCTPFTVAALAWAEALASISGGKDVCFATPFTMRDLPLSERQFGYWVHPLPLRLEGKGGQDVKSRLAEAARSIRLTMSHRGLSLSDAMRCAGLKTPAAFLVFQGEARFPRTWLGSAATARTQEASACKVPMGLVVSGEGVWKLALEHHPQAVSGSVAQRCLSAFVNACRNFAGVQEVPKLSLLRGERFAPLEHRTVVEAFHARVLADAQATALVFDKGSVDYGTLAGQVRATATALSRAGVAPGDRVGVCSQAGPAWVAAMLACFESSAVYVPLDPAYPSERLKAMLEDADCRVVLSDFGRPAWAGDRVWMDLEEALTARPPFLRSPGRPRPQDPAYVIFTSGSSGRPKGVQVSHAAVMNNARAIGARMSLTAGDRVLQFISISFDPSIQEILPTLVAGGSIALPMRKGAPGPAELADWVRRYEPSTFVLPTAYWHAFMQSGGAEHLKGLRCLRSVMVGGEAPAPRWLREWNRVLGGQTVFYNAYGPTESCVTATLLACTAGMDMDDPVPLGLPIPGVELAVVGPDGRVLPAGETGELWIAGASLADGYLGPAGLDTSRFSPAAPDGAAARPFYRTGDLANVDSRGRLVFRGRLDRQIKAAGVRMDLEEIESLLARAEGVSAAVVEAEGAGDGLVLKAWVAAEKGRRPKAQALADWLGKRLPKSCVPGSIMVLESFPVGPGGKLDRAALKKLPAARTPNDAGQGRADSWAERHNANLVDPLCSVFSEILNRAVGPQDDFFALGGTSLRAVHLAGEASRRLERNVLVDQIYQAPTPAGLAALLGGGQWTDLSAVLTKDVGDGPVSHGALLDTLCALFSGILGRPIAPQDDFFALGGTSLRAVHLAGEASRTLERDIPVDLIYQAPTPLALFSRLQGPSAKETGAVLQRLAEGPGPDWILLPPVSGRLECYRGLAALLAGRCSVWGMDLERLAPPDAGGWEAWVEACARAVQERLPDSDLVVGGWSMGGLLASDIARRLAAKGRQVRRIILIDAVQPDPLDSALMLHEEGVLEELVERDLDGNLRLAPGGDASDSGGRKRYHQNARALTGFVPKPLEIPLSLVVSQRSAQEQPRAAWMAWSLMARAGMTCQLVPGDHFTILNGPALKRIAARLEAEVRAGASKEGIPA
jgi:amino acid adenylation domain-containing protein